MTSSRRLLLGVLAGGLVLLGVLALALVIGRNGGSGATPSVGGSRSGDVSSSPGPPTTGGKPSATTQAQRVWLIVLENRSFGQLIGSTDAPFMNELAARYGLATDYHGVARPSQPNYIALISGSTQGVHDDDPHDLDAPTLLDQLEAAGRSWRVFAENVRPGCFVGARSSGGPDGPGTYARKHEPAISFVAISRNPSRCANILYLSAFDPAAADFNLIVPNLCHDMHDCSTRVGDRWLSQFVPRITGSDAFRAGGLLLITFDEASGRDDSQHTVLLFAGANVSPGSRATARADHYGLLRTLQERLGVGCLAESCAAADIPQLLPGS